MSSIFVLIVSLFSIQTFLLDKTPNSNDSALLHSENDDLTSNNKASFLNDSKCNQLLPNVVNAISCASPINPMDNSSINEDEPIRKPHPYPITYNSSSYEREISVPNFKDLADYEKELILESQMDKIDTSTSALRLHGIIYVNELLFYYSVTNDTKIKTKFYFMEKLLEKFFKLFSIKESIINAKSLTEEEENDLQLNAFALFAILYNSDSFQSKENDNQYDKLFQTLTTLYTRTLNSPTNDATNRLILGTMAIYIDLFPYQEKEKDQENNQNNPLNNIAKENTKNLISFLPTFATKKFYQNQPGDNPVFDNFIFDIYDNTREKASIKYDKPNSKICFQPQALINALNDVTYIAVYAYPYYPKISITTSDYDHSFIGIKAFSKNFEEQRVNYIAENVRPKIEMIVPIKENSPKRFCYFFNEEDFNPFSNLGIKQTEKESSPNTLSLLCTVKMLRDFTYGDRQIMRLVWIGVLAGISLIILIVLFVLFVRFKKNGNDQDASFMLNRQSQVF